MASAEAGVEQTSAKALHGGLDGDVFGRLGEAVAAELAASSGDEPAFAEKGEDFGDVGLGEAFEFADFGDREGLFGRDAGETEKATEPVFFLRADFHGFRKGRVRGGCVRGCGRW